MGASPYPPISGVYAGQLFTLIWCLVWITVWFEVGEDTGALGRGLWITECVAEPTITAIFLADMFVTSRTVYAGDFDMLVSEKKAILRRYIRTAFAMDLISALPVHWVSALWSGRRLGGLWAILHCNRLLRLFRSRRLFQDFHGAGRRIDARYVDTYFTYVPRLRLLFWCFCCLHLLALCKHAVSLYFDGDVKEGEGGYWRAVFWCWSMLTTAPVQLGLKGPADHLYAAFMLVLSQVMQGVIVGKVSLLLLKDDIEGMNQGRLRDVLTVMRHYSVPLVVQNEVLSFHHYNMQENVAVSAADILQGLPPQMEREIQLYIKLNLVGRVPLFMKVSEDLRIILARMLREEFVEPGGVVVRSGDVGNEMYFVGYGTAEVLVGPSMQAVATLSKGNFFGEIALLENCRRTATIVAMTYLHLFVLDKPVFTYIVQTFPEFGEAIVGELDDRGRQGAAKRAGRRGTTASMSPSVFGEKHASMRPAEVLNGKEVFFDLRDAADRQGLLSDEDIRSESEGRGQATANTFQRIQKVFSSHRFASAELAGIDGNYWSAPNGKHDGLFQGVTSPTNPLTPQHRTEFPTSATAQQAAAAPNPFQDGRVNRSRKVRSTVTTEGTSASGEKSEQISVSFQGASEATAPVQRRSKPEPVASEKPLSVSEETVRFEAGLLQDAMAELKSSLLVEMRDVVRAEVEAVVRDRLSEQTALLSAALEQALRPGDSPRKESALQKSDSFRRRSLPPSGPRHPLQVALDRRRSRDDDLVGRLRQISLA
eukprot:TRINITY_DN16640_c0_g1_i2.p1 TRINITY_DN16640_c0_g1~~TRINITY_DN16640_c0_g1_i2.p1  ORF type:complete len:765 (+),score=162.05 TRINITY_DN16640_c0_g1_i2:86-2380(+)